MGSEMCIRDRSNEGRGYVLSRIMRRAMRHIHMLGNHGGMMCDLVPSLIKEMGGHFTELKEFENIIQDTLYLEENKFKETLEHGLKILDNEIHKMGKKKVLDGSIAFTLYDTYGFPLDLTQDILRSRNKIVDLEGFKKSMEKQKICLLYTSPSPRDS